MRDEYIEFSYVTRGRKGTNGRKLTAHVPQFDWQKFLNSPNAADFAEKAYFQAVKQIMWEIDTGKNGTSADHLNSMEAIITRALPLPAQRIKEWCNTRDWGRVNFKGSREQAMQKTVTALCCIGKVNAEMMFQPADRKRLADIVSQVADKADRRRDGVAEFLFEKLMADRTDTFANLDI